MPENRDIPQNRYLDIIKWVFRRNFKDGSTEVCFARSELAEAARDLGLDVPKNLGDIVYSIRYRTEMPAEINQLAPAGMTWALFPAGRSHYAFRPVAVNQISIARERHYSLVLPENLTDQDLQEYRVAAARALELT